MEEELVFDSLEPAVAPVKLAGKAYVMVEASEAAAAKYRNFAARQVKYTPEGKLAGVGDVADAQALLVSLCLFEAEGRVPVPVQIVRGWPARVVGPLFEAAKRMGGIDQETEESLGKRIAADQARLAELKARKGGAESEEGNSPGSGTPTSASPES